MNYMKIQNWIEQNKKMWRMFLVLIFISVVFSFLQYTHKTKQITTTQNLDTYIPEGFVLVPIELNNSSLLDGLLKSTGIVDLYINNTQSIKKIASSVKIIRSPRNPSLFAVLVPENKADILIQQIQPFHAVIQHPHQHQKTSFRIVNKKKPRSIVIEIDNVSNF